MNYCTNCGAETHAKICTACGVKNNKTHRYCYWCGSEINDNASICTACHESVKNLGSPMFFKVIDIALILLNLFFVFGFVFIDGNIGVGVFHIMAIVVLLPFVSKWIRRISFKSNRRKLVRNGLYALRVIIVIVLFLVGLGVALTGESGTDKESSSLRIPDLPMAVENKAGSTLKGHCEITEITYEFDYDASGKPICLTGYFSGEKIGGYKNTSERCMISWKLYDSKNSVVDSGTLYTPSLAVGERFSSESVILFYEPDGLEPGVFRLELSDVVVVK